MNAEDLLRQMGFVPADDSNHHGNEAWTHPDCAVSLSDDEVGLLTSERQLVRFIFAHGRAVGEKRVQTEIINALGLEYRLAR